MAIRHLADDDKPREKFEQKGRHALSDSELLALIIENGSREHSAMELAQIILDECKRDWNILAQLSLTELQKFKGIGIAKAVKIAATMEISKRKAAQIPIERPKISSSSDAYSIVKFYLEDLKTEEFWVIFLNNSNKVLHKEQFTRGGISSSSVDLRPVFKRALEHLATAIILCHNHPSDNPKPSQQDLDITKKSVEAGKLLDISVLDHIIVYKGGYFSFADSGLI